MPTLRNHLIQGAFGSLGLKLIQSGFNFFLGVLLARLLGVEGFGIYALCISIVNLLVIPAMLGGQHLLVREISTYRSKKKFSYIVGMIGWIRKATAITSLALIIGASGVVWIIFDGNEKAHIFILSLCMIPFLSVVNLQNAALRGFQRIFLGQISLVLMPLLFIVGIMILLFNKPYLNPETAIILQTVSVGLMALTTAFFLQKFIPAVIKKAPPKLEASRWIKSMMPFMFIGIMQAFNNEISLIFLGIMKDTESVALFRVAQRGSDLVPFGLFAVNMTIAPTIAELYAKRQILRLQNIIAKSTVLIIFFAVPLASSFFIWGSQLISFVFGEEYVSAYVPLMILCVGQLFNACTGSVGISLNMMGLEKLVNYGVMISTFLNFLLNILLIPIWGVSGAAIASTMTLFVWNTLLAIWLYMRTGISIFAGFMNIIKLKRSII